MAASDTTIQRIHAWQAFDSRGNPTPACRIELGSGAAATAIAPSGASTGASEAREIRDGAGRFAGLAVSQAVDRIRSLRDLLVGLDLGADPTCVDKVIDECDPTPDLRTLGGNATTALSLAALKAAAAANRCELVDLLAGTGRLALPVPMVNVVSGGAHAGGAIDIQDVLVISLRATSVFDSLADAWSVRRAATTAARARGWPADLVADEGGLGLPLPSNEAALEFVTAAIAAAGFEPGRDVALAVDVAASQLVRHGKYQLRRDGLALTPTAFAEVVERWLSTYPIVSIEDPFAETDTHLWRELAAPVQVVGDDLFATQAGLVAQGARDALASAVLVKPNQAGSVLRAKAALHTARAAGMRVVVSARSGDTEESWLADLAVGWAADQIKVGSLMRSERLAKWNRLLEIEAASPDATFAGARTALGLVSRHDDHVGAQ